MTCIRTAILFATACILLLLPACIQSRSMAVEQRGMPGLWKPSKGTRDQWLQYHGMPRDQWQRINDILETVDHVQKSDIAREDQQLAASSSGESMGCMWYTEDQADGVLQEAIEEASVSGESLKVEELLKVKVTKEEEEETNETDETDETEGSGEVEQEDFIKTHKTKHNNEHHRQKRKIANMEKNPDSRWHNPIFYKFDGTHSERETAIIQKAFKHWQEHTCLRFFQVNANAPIPQQHLLLSGEVYGCYSFVGKTSTIPQQVNLASACLHQLGVPVHEIGHALGLWHEHQRADRDKWINILSDKIMFYASQFWKRDTVSHGVPYDYTSVMHYAPNAGSFGSQLTMEPVDPLYTRSMGQRVGLSYLDAKIVNLEYCQDRCKHEVPRPCERGGYQDPNDCYSCRCPDGFGGRYCQVPAQSSEGCGGEIQVGYEPVTIQTPGYIYPGYYDESTDCNWVIKFHNSGRGT